MQEVGDIQLIYRYPVKSFQGEQLSSTQVERYGMYGDRGYAFIDHTRSNDETRSNKKLNAKFAPKLLAYSSAYLEEGTGEGFPPVQITTPDGRYLAWDEELFAEIRAVVAPREISPKLYSPVDDDLLGVDEACLLLTTDVSLAKLEQMVGLHTDIRRFRPNLVIRRTGSGGYPFEEFDWVGKTLKIGDVILEIYKKCRRCSMVNVDPEDNAANPVFLKHIAKRLGANFGVYAKVVQTGIVSVHDKVYLTT
ncbi:MOSC domain-containing protein [Paenibacillus donghaensis]|uniref:MOSC domain-containing protein n=1 Tax=Paenibacillus donghaensis TaxID=414771 RepID=UPI0018833E6B|nr:MOSC domain-containing protein [Paenibacillus donghaensis]MBE9915409.1 MOSC domain-containing protein [Paenibacillus donghaensis]